MRYRTILLEDEPPARDRLRKMLREHKVIDLIGEAENGAQGLEMIEALKPDLLFLDIQMPVMTGFEVLDKLNYSPKVVFTTAYDEFALKAFETNTVDYLLKPINPQRLALTLRKLDQMAPVNNLGELRELFQQLRPEAPLTSLTVTVGDRMVLIKPEEIVFLQAADKYVELYTHKGKKYLLDYSLTALEKRLSDNFLRIHRSYLINRDFLREIRKSFNGKWIFYLRGAEEYKLASGGSYLPELRKTFSL
ncbi:MAG: LytR/AlgR family response regulator transcription factor [Salibacteraceae bacterium]